MTADHAPQRSDFDDGLQPSSPPWTVGLAHGCASISLPTRATFVGGLRTAWGAPDGVWADTHAIDLAAQLVEILRDREPDAFEGHGRCHFATATPLGELSMNAGQVLCTGSGLEAWAGRTFDGERRGGQLALHDAVELPGVRLVVGVDVETRMPFGSGTELGIGAPLGSTARQRHEWPARRQLSERFASATGIDRRAVDEWAYDARAAGRQTTARRAELTVLDRKQGDGPSWSRTPSLSQMSAAPALLSADGLLTSKNVARGADGAAALLLSNRQLSHLPSARVVACSESAGPVATSFERMLDLIEVTAAAAELLVGDIQLWEVDDADPVLALSLVRHFGLLAECVNPWGGALSSGLCGGVEPLRRTLRLIARAVEQKRPTLGLECTIGATGSVGVTILQVGL